jgi:hypothetical protein
MTGSGCRVAIAFEKSAAVDSKPASEIGKTWANVAPISVLP